MTYRLDIQAFVDLHDRPFLIIDRHFRVVAINSAFERHYGVVKSLARGQRCCELIQGDGRPCPCDKGGSGCHFQQVFAGEGPKACETSYRDEEGRNHRVQMTGYPLATPEGEVFLGELIHFDHFSVEPQVAHATAASSAMAGASPGFLRMLDELGRAARSEASVLIWGETGTGKELAAAHVHAESSRKDGPFLTLDCTSIAGDLFESEVFGHSRGAFTGSVGEKPGLFELADGGTLFLDEIGELSLGMQSKLLRVLENGQFRRVGGIRQRRADVRVICATNRELQGAPWFRQDLYYRVACFRVNLPPLVDRLQDLPLLANAILQQIATASKQTLRLGADALSALERHDFPGNIRELRNILWVASANSAEGLIGAREIAMGIPRRPARTDAAPEPRASSSLGVERAEPAVGALESVADFERKQFLMLLEEHHGNRRAVASSLGVSERTVYRKLKRYRLE